MGFKPQDPAKDLVPRGALQSRQAIKFSDMVLAQEHIEAW